MITTKQNIPTVTLIKTTDNAVSVEFYSKILNSFWIMYTEKRKKLLFIT